MKYFVLLVLLGGPGWRLLTWVRDRNAAVATGTAAYAQGDATSAARAFAAALATRPCQGPDARLVLNLAHAQNRAGQVALARATYGRLLADSRAGLGSVARQQLAVLAARQGDIAQALGLLHQALLLDASNSGARYDYEVLSEYLARRPGGPRITPPSPTPTPAGPKPSPDKNAAPKNQPTEQAGNERQGKIDEAKPAPHAPPVPPKRRPNPAGPPNNRPLPAAPGSGPPQPLASGAAPGSQRGPDPNSEAPGAAASSQSPRPGTQNAAPTDLRLQTQRARLRAMSLSPAQARQILETLRAQEQQYLQQLARPTQQKPNRDKPTW